MKTPRKKGERNRSLKHRDWDINEVTAVLTGRGFIVYAACDDVGCTIMAVKGQRRHQIRIEYGKLVLLFKGDDLCR